MINLKVTEAATDEQRKSCANVEVLKNVNPKTLKVSLNLKAFIRTPKIEGIN